jgi:hypothetical protein
LRAKIRGLGKKPPASQRSDIADKRNALVMRISSHHRRLEQYLPFIPSSMEQPVTVNDLEDGIDEEQEEWWETSDDQDMPEKQRIKLPSTLGASLLQDPHGLAEQEKQLRVSQAHSALESMKYSLGEASVQYKLQGRKAQSGQNTRTRAYAQGKAALSEAEKHWRIYNRARNTLLHLPNSQESLALFQIIQKKDLKPSPDIYHENRVGQRSTELPWFWRMPDATGRSKANMSEWHEECE